MERGKWEYDIVTGFMSEFQDLKKEIENRLNDSWQIHGMPFQINDELCQVVVKFNPPKPPATPESKRREQLVYIAGALGVSIDEPDTELLEQKTKEAFMEFCQKQLTPPGNCS